MSFPVPDWEGFKNEQDKSFVRTLQEELTATSLFGAPRVVRDLGVQILEWKKYGQDPGAAISLEIPAFQPTSGGAPTSFSAQIPVFVKDASWDERDLLAARAAGVDTVEAEEKAFAMAQEVNNYLLFGKSSGPGATTGILNHADILTVNNSGTTNWTVGSDMVKDLNEGIAKLLNAKQRGEKVLLMNPLDGDLMSSFITNTSVQASEKLPGLVRPQVLFEEKVAQNTAYLVTPSTRNYQAIVPGEVGAVGRVLRRGDRDEITGGVRNRWLTALGLQVKHGTGVCKLTFDRA